MEFFFDRLSLVEFCLCLFDVWIKRKLFSIKPPSLRPPRVPGFRLATENDSATRSTPGVRGFLPNRDVG
jgi:hypothetical protein